MNTNTEIKTWKERAVVHLPDMGNAMEHPFCDIRASYMVCEITDLRAEIARLQAALAKQVDDAPVEMQGELPRPVRIQLDESQITSVWLENKKKTEVCDGGDWVRYWKCESDTYETGRVKEGDCKLIEAAIDATLAALAQRVMSETVLEQHYDDYAVNCFARLMKEKMAISRAKGRSGWEDKEKCSVAYLQRLFHEHVQKGDPVDVANLCMMLRHYQASTTPDFDTWSENPYTKVLQKSISEDYVPATDKPPAAPVALSDAEILKLAVAHGVESREFPDEFIIEFSRAILAAATQPTDADKRDAVRYRLLKQHHESAEPCTFCIFYADDDNSSLIPVGSMPGELDENIDDVIAASAKEAK